VTARQKLHESQDSSHQKLSTMPPNDSDSSDEESGSFTTTNVLLGYASKEPTDDVFSQLGGYPVSIAHFL